MKVQFFHSKSGGPGVFMRRLRYYLVDHYGIKVTANKPHLYLSAVWRGDPPKGAKTVHRVDNCYFDKLNQSSKRLNRKIKVAIKNAHGVIYQSKFSLSLCNGIIGIKPRRRDIIHNGFDQSICNDVVPFESQYKHLFVACAMWRPIKRPKAIIKAFRKAEIPDSGLIMIGKGIKKPPSDSRIICTGDIKSSDTYKYYKAASAIIHISRLESCPNIAVEGLSFGKPVVCNNAGGTKEIVGKDGIIVNLDPPDKFRQFAMENPGSIDLNKLAVALRDVVNKKWDIHRPDLGMKHCADQYFKFFNKVLNKK